MKLFRFIASIVVICVLYSDLVFSQESKEDLAKAAQNPIANMMSFPFQDNINFGMGPYNRTQNVLNFQPVLPFASGRVITRTIIPVITQPDLSAESGSSTGFGDITFSAFYAPLSKGIIWGVGPVVNFPTAGTGLGAHEWGLGPSLVALMIKGKWVAGAIVNNIWSLGNRNINSLLFQYFINYNLPNGVYLSSAPIITSDWNAEDGNKWTVPFGLGGGKIVKLGGKLPLNLQAGAYFNAVKPDNGADWTIRFMAVVLLPTNR